MVATENKNILYLVSRNNFFTLATFSKKKKLVFAKTKGRLGPGEENDYGTDSRTELDNHILLAAWYDWYMTYVAKNSKDERRWLKLFP